jgi:hypothetical protein
LGQEVKRENIVSRGMVASNHFTVLGFTAATGEAIMCVIIVAGKTIRLNVITGLDAFALKIGDESDSDFITNNSGSRKIYPNAPTCAFKGKEVPCMVCHIENGSISSELLVRFL